LALCPITNEKTLKKMSEKMAFFILKNLIECKLIFSFIY
jgi:hypothetical protein